MLRRAQDREVELAKTCRVVRERIRHRNRVTGKMDQRKRRINSSKLELEKVTDWEKDKYGSEKLYEKNWD
jgi:hypothetical protein